MTTDAPGAFAALRARAEAQLAGLSPKFQDERIVLPDTPAAFVYFELITDRAQLAGFGDGRGGNLYRNPGEWHGYVMVPRGQGLAVALTKGETVAAAFRSFRDDAVSCFGAGVHPVGEGADLVPPGLRSAAGNYACAVVIVDLFYDQIG